ncbi:hypothetical protein LTR28_011178, partial [Elasticomyces elasticus]
MTPQIHLPPFRRKPKRPTISQPTPCPHPSPFSTTDQPAPDHPVTAIILREWDACRWDRSSDALADWLNARWRKSGYGISREE